MTLIFSIHYFLWYGALTSIFGYEGVYARYYTRATTMQYGYLNMVLPFMTVLVTPVVCSLADRRRSHRAYFTNSLLCTLLAMSLYTFLPLVVPFDKLGTKSRLGSSQKQSQQTNDLLIGPWVYFCIVSLFCDLAMGINTCLSDSFAVLQAEEQNTSFGRIIVWGTFGWALSGLILCLINQTTLMPRLVPGLLFGTFLLALDLMIVTYWTRGSDFKLDIIPMDAARTLTGSTSITHREPNDYLPLNESARINLGSDYEEASKSNNPMKVKRKTKSPVQICNEALGNVPAKKSDVLDPFNLTIKTINSESDFMPKQQPRGLLQGNSDRSSSTSDSYDSRSLKPELKNETDSVSPYERKDLNGATKQPFGFGANQDQVVEIKQKQAAASDQQVKREGSSGKRSREMLTSFRMQMILLYMIMTRRKSLIRYLILFILSGFFMSMHWNYFFLYLEEIYYDKFEIISAISMIGQSVLGELPFFILSRKVIDLVGRSHTLSISVISIGIRFLLYGYLLPNVNMYYIIIADCFQGPNYGLFYVVMTEVGLEYSFCDDDTIERLAARGELDRNNKRQVDSVRLSLRSTVQSVAFACYEGVGVGLGSAVGGWIVASYGFRTLWVVMAFCSIAVGSINLLVEFMCVNEAENMLADDELDGANSEQREFVQARRKGTLKKLASPHPLPPAPAVAQARNRSPFRFPEAGPRAKVEAALARKGTIGDRSPTPNNARVTEAAAAAAKPFR